MKKIILSFVILLASVASFNAQPVVGSANPSFNEVYQEVLKLNTDRFANVNQIQIGDSVMFPSLTGLGTEFLIADYPVNGIHDCLYRMTGKYIAGQLPTQPVQPVITEPVEPMVVEPIEELSNPDFWAWFIIIGLMLLVIAAYLLNRFRPWNNRGNINRRPVVSGGLSNNAAEAASQISALTPGSRVVSSVRGRLICASPVKVEMHFSDGVKKVQLVSGEEYYKITQEDGTIRYARRACGNLVTGSISELPEGVTFVPSTEENSSWTATPTNAATEEKSPKTEADTNTDTEEDSPIEVYSYIIEESSDSEIVELLKVAGEMSNKPLKITYKDLTVEFAPQIEKTEDK